MKPTPIPPPDFWPKMKKTTIATLAAFLVLGAIGVLLYGPLGEDARVVRHLSDRFMEDLQFKDFRSSGLYHHRFDRDRVDIGKALERLFLVKPEMLNIIDYELVEADVDSSGERARVHVRTRFKRLNMKDEPEDGELMLYWIKRHPDCPIGASCPTAGQCVDEFGEVIERTDDEDEEAAAKPAQETAKAEPQTYACDPAQDKRWFMNLDSTLEAKDYRR